MTQAQPLASTDRKRVFDPTDPLSIARTFTQDMFIENGCPTLHHISGEFFAYRGNRYRSEETETIRALLYRYLDKAFVVVGPKGKLEPFKPRRSSVNEVLTALEVETHRPSNVVRIPFWFGKERADRPDPKGLLACSNGLLHLPTLELLAPTPFFVSTSALSFPYDKEAAEPERWFKFLAELWPDDLQSIETLQELFGYLLVPDTRQHKIFLIIGPKRSGKGTIGRVLVGLLGRDNVGGPTLSSLSKNFGLWDLIGKRLAIISDARIGHRTNKTVVVERLLTISGEDILTIDRKFLPAWTGQLTCRILMLTNELPHIVDPSGAFASRFIILKLNESFYGKEDETLTDRLLEELPGILNWAIVGWQRLQDRGRFRQPRSAIETVHQFEDMGSPISAFLRVRCNVGLGQEVIVEKLFEEYKSWCKQEDMRGPPDVQTFGRELRSVMPNIETKQRRVEGKPAWHYLGIGLK